MIAYLVVFAAGFAGSLHCIGMCGGFACALGPARGGPRATALRHLLYNSGRLTSYCFLGALAGATGQFVCSTAGAQETPFQTMSADTIQRILAVVAGLLMVVMSLQFFGLLRSVHRATAGLSAIFSDALRQLLRAPGHAAPLAFGVLNGFLPCPLVYAFVAQAVATASALSGLLTMVAFGLGTFPAMLMMGGVGIVLRPSWRRRGVWVAGSFILALGLVTLGRGILPTGLLHGDHAI